MEIFGEERSPPSEACCRIGREGDGKKEKQGFLPYSGFTLLEVMIALVILALVGVAFLRAQAGSVHLVDESGQISIATLLAREKMAELESMGFPDSGEASGEGDETFPQYHWERVVSSTDIPAVRKAVVRI